MTPELFLPFLAGLAVGAGIGYYFVAKLSKRLDIETQRSELWISEFNLLNEHYKVLKDGAKSKEEQTKTGLI